MKKTKLALLKWNRKSFGDIFKQLTIKEKIVKLKEKLVEENSFAVAHVEYTKYLKFEKDFWRKKSGM